MTQHPKSTPPRLAKGVKSLWPAALRSIFPVAAPASALVIFIIDAFFFLDIAIAVLYVAVVLMSVTFFGRRGVLAVSAACIALTVIAFLIQHSPDEADSLA